MILGETLALCTVSFGQIVLESRNPQECPAEKNYNSIWCFACSENFLFQETLPSFRTTHPSPLNPYQHANVSLESWTCTSESLLRFHPSQINRPCNRLDFTASRVHLHLHLHLPFTLIPHPFTICESLPPIISFNSKILQQMSSIPGRIHLSWTSCGS